MNALKNNKGFTLVEIMIVVGIIAILSGLFLVGSGQFRNSANDARRKADMQKIASFQALCYTKSGSYAANGSALRTCANVGASAIPNDPVSGSAYTISASSTCATLSNSSSYCVSYE